MTILRDAAALAAYYDASYNARASVAGYAGGHLVGMLLAKDWQAEYGLPPNVLRGALPISGLFDLHTHVNGWMRQDAAAARGNSPQLLLPSAAGELAVAYGALETAEFARQSADYLRTWRSRRLPGRLLGGRERNHMDAVLELGQPGTPLYQVLVQLMGLVAE